MQGWRIPIRWQAVKSSDRIMIIGGYMALVRVLTNPDDSIGNGEDRQKSKASAPGRARIEPSGTLIFTKGRRRLYDLLVLSATGTLSITSRGVIGPRFYWAVSSLVTFFSTLKGSIPLSCSRRKRIILKPLSSKKLPSINDPPIEPNHTL